MNRRPLASAVAALAGALLLAAPADADLLVSDGFDGYADRELVGQDAEATGMANRWFGDRGTFVVGQGLDHDGLAASGGAIRGSFGGGNFRQVSRVMDGSLAVKEGPLYLAFLIRRDTETARRTTLNFPFGRGGVPFELGVAGGKVVAFTADGLQEGPAYETGETVLIVARLDVKEGADDFSVYVDPDLAAEPEGEAAISGTTELIEPGDPLGNVQPRFAGERLDDVDEVTFDELRVADGYADLAG